MEPLSTDWICTPSKEMSGFHYRSAFRNMFYSENYENVLNIEKCFKMYLCATEKGDHKLFPNGTL